MNTTDRRPLPSTGDLRDLFDYDPISGLLYRRDKNYPPITGGKGRYIFVTIKGVKYGAHRVIYKWMTGEEPYIVEHSDDNNKNNRWWNLCPSDHRGNMHTRAVLAGNACGCFESKGRFYSRTIVNGVTIRLGSYSTRQEAYDAYLNYHNVTDQQPN